MIVMGVTGRLSVGGIGRVKLHLVEDWLVALLPKHCIMLNRHFGLLSHCVCAKIGVRDLK